MSLPVSAINTQRQIPTSILVSGVRLWLLFSSGSSVAPHCWLKFLIEILNLSTVASVLSNNMKTLASLCAHSLSGGTREVQQTMRLRRTPEMLIRIDLDVDI